MEATNQQSASTETPIPADVASAQNSQTQTQVQAQPTIPEKYEFKLEQSPLDKSYLESFQTYAKEQKMTQDQAQKLLERESFAVNEYLNKQNAEFEKTQSQWVEAIKQDQEIGGDNFNKNIELAHRALKKYGTPQFIQDLEQSGFGNHPELVRIFARIGKSIGEDSMISTNTNTGGKKSYEEIFYGSQN